MILITKEQFLEQYNKLSPSNLKATMALLTRFQQEKKPLLKDDQWCLDKLRIPFITWLASQPKKEEKPTKRAKEKEIYRNYPETHYDA